MRVHHMLQEPFHSPLGRGTELSKLLQSLSYRNDWKLVHIHGPGGIGKTTLLKLLARKIGEDRCLLFDGYTQIHTPNDWLSRLTKLMDGISAHPIEAHSEQTHSNPLAATIERLNRLAVDRGGIVLLFDTFESWGPIEEWLRIDCLPLLESHVRVCSAGRYPLEGAWNRDGWKHLVQNFKLSPLSKTDLDSYVLSQGIQDPLIREKLRKFTGGIPLAVSMAVEIIKRKSTPSFLDSAEQHHTIEYLMEELMKDMDHPAFQTYIDVASVLWRFNQEWLQLLLGEFIPTELFREFCRLPIIISYPDGWGLHDSIRNWARADLLRRKPRTLEAYRLKALEHIRKLDHVQPVQKSALTIDKLYLHENDLVRQYCFSGEVSGYSVLTCSEQDLPRLEELYLAFNRSRRLLSSSMVGYQPMIRPLWNEDPAGFFGIWKHGSLVAFYTFIHLNERTLDLLSSHSVTAPFLNQSVRTAREYAILFVGMEPSLEEEVGGALAQFMMQPFNKARMIYNLSPYQEWFPVLEYIGFERFHRGDSTSSEGTAYGAFRLDLSEEDYPAKIDRLFSGSTTLPKKSRPKLESDQAFALIKNLLIHYHVLQERLDDVEALMPYCEFSGQEPDLSNQIRLIQERTAQCLEQMEQGLSEDQANARLLRLAYIQKIGSHEAIADRLQLPQSTYYRHLKKATARLAALYLDSSYS